MTLFSKPINEITYDDVVKFCEGGIGESVNLDYKRDFPNDLGKTISAFANSFGGIIIIGVDDKDSKPNPPFVGIDYQDKLEERVWNIIVDNIYPPVSAEIQVCPPQNNKTFLVIRIPQSADAPHAIRNKTQAYIRTGNRNNPEDLATIGQIEWLENRRQQSIDLRNSLKQRQLERYTNICNTRKLKIEFGELTLFISPLFPRLPLLNPSSLEAKCQNARVIDSEVRSFPPNNEIYRPVQDGIASFFFNKNNNFITYTDVTSYGTVLYKEDFGWLRNQGEESIKHIYLDTLIKLIDVTFEACGKLYNELGYWGLVKIELSLEKILGLRVIPFRSQPIAFPSLYHGENEAESQLSWELETSVTELNDSTVRQKEIIEMGLNISWSLGVASREERIIERLKERGRWTADST